MKQQRLFEIIYALMTHEVCTVGELARMLEVSPRTVRRDIEAIVRHRVLRFSYRDNADRLTVR